MEYAVQKGDTLWNIAKNNFKLTDDTDIANKVIDIASANKIENPDLIFAGQNISFDLPDNFSSSDDNQQNENLTDVQKFDQWTNQTDKDSTIQYAKQGETKEETAQNILNFSKQYVDTFGKNQNIDIKAFMNTNSELDEKSANSIYKMIDMDGKNGITADEYASYLSVIDNADGKFDGNMNLDNYNTIGAEIPVFADESYKEGGYKELHEKSKQGFEYAAKLMEHFHNNFYKEN